jgi:hypothetical protein
MTNKKMYFKKYYQLNKTKIKNCVSEWQKNNKEKVTGYKRKHKHEMRAISRLYINNIKNNTKCCVCNETTPCCLDFHHIDSKLKDGEISRLMNDGSSLDILKNEISKCKIMCSNCHRKLHFFKKPNDRTLKFKFAYETKINMGCFYCKESHFSCLDYHHTHDNKIDSISKMTKTSKYSLDDVKKEINKCIVICTNCHRKLHNGIICYPSS